MTPWFPITVCWILLLAALTPVDAVAEVAFEKQILTERFVAEGCAVADFDRDGHADITAGNAAPHFRTEGGAVIKLYQQTTGVGSATRVGGGGTTLTDTDTFGGYTLRQIVQALQNAGFLS